MAIQERRFNKAINQIIREELQKGNLPSSKEVLWRLNDYLREHNLSRPNYNYQPVRGTARAVDYNTALNKVYEDFETLYENTIEIHNNLSKNFSKFETDKLKLEYELNILENTMKELILLYSKNGFLNTVYDMFDDITKVDAAKSSVQVDIRNHEASIADIKNTSKRISPKASVSFSILDEIAKTVVVDKISGSPSDALSDSLNETWQLNVRSSIKQEVAGYYHINFDNKQVMNRIGLELHDIKPTFVRAEFTPDGLNWFGIPYYEEGLEITNSRFVFDFPSVEVEELRFLISKDEPDTETTTSKGVQYNYLIGIKKIDMYEMDFSEEGVLISTPLEVNVPAGQNFSISKVSLQVDEVLPNGTSIDYYIAIPVEDKDPEWKPISPVNHDKPEHDLLIDFKNITRSPAVKLGIDPNISIGEYELESEYANGISFYKIGQVENKKIIAGTEKLFVGANSWGVKKFTGQFSDHATHVPSLNDWSKPLNSIQYDYVAIEDGKPGVILDKKKHTVATSCMFTLGVLSQKEQELKSAIITSTEPVAIYMNGALLFQGLPNSKTRINYLFRYGWNEIVVLLYTRNPNAANGVTTEIGFDPREYGANIYAQAKPMEKVSLFDLRFNVKNNDRNKYAIKDAGDDTSYIVINHATPGLEYDFLFDYVEGEAKQSILLRADFYRDRNITNISPKLKSYRLRFS